MRLRDIDPEIIEGGCALGFIYDLLEQVEGIEDMYSRVRTDASYRTYSAEIRQYLRQYLKAKIKRGELQVEYRIFYEYERLELKRVSLYLMAMADREEVGECVMRKFDNFPTLEEVKAKAEAHLLEIICRPLGIND